MKIGTRRTRIEFHWDDFVRGIGVWVAWRQIWNPLVYYFWTRKPYGYPIRGSWHHWPRDNYDLRYNDGFCIGCGRMVNYDAREGCDCDKRGNPVETITLANQPYDPSTTIN